MTGLLREELGFQGVIVTDALDMAGASGGRGIPAAAVASLAAGADLLCIGTRNTDAQIGEIAEAITAAVADGTLPAERLADAIARVESLGSDLGDGPLGARRCRVCQRGRHRRRAKGLPRVRAG